MTDRASHSRYVLNVLGQDRPGIVATVSRAMADAGCNIEDSSMRLLQGAFAMVLIVTAPPGAENAFRTALVGITATQGLRVYVDSYPEADEGLRKIVEGDGFSLQVRGADRPGIVAAVTGLLAAESINVVDLSTRIIDGAPPVFLAAMELVAPASVDIPALRTRLADLGRDIDCAISLTETEPPLTIGRA